MPDDVRAEVIHGMIVEKDAPSFEHSASQSHFGSVLLGRIEEEAGGHWSTGGWFGTEAEVQYKAHEIFVHDLAGWRRDRVPERPTGHPVLTRPDWVCELVSPSSQRRDRVDKFQVLHQSGVPHYWIADPIEHVLEVHRWQENGYLVVLTAKAGDTLRAEPFDAVELRVSALFGLEDDEE